MQQKRKTCYVFGGMILAAPLIAFAAWTGSGESKTAPIDSIAWIQGTWFNESGGRRSEEHWIAPRGGTMLGLSRTISGSKTVAFEFLRIEQRGDELIYHASPGGRCPATEFAMTTITDNRVVFENPEHDFPQRIIYEKTASGLKARIEGNSGGQPRGMEWTWTRE